MEAPERIWIAPVYGATRPDDFYLIDPEYRNGRGVEYIRADLLDAHIGAVLEEAADCAYNLRREDWASENEDWDCGTHDAAVAISSLRPDALQALERVRREARVEGE